VVAARADADVAVWDPERHRELARSTGTSQFAGFDGPTGIAASSDGRTVAEAGTRGKVAAWRLGGGRIDLLGAGLVGGGGTLGSPRLSADGRWLALDASGGLVLSATCGQGASRASGRRGRAAGDAGGGG
jgi:hypothetical protein